MSVMVPVARSASEILGAGGTGATRNTAAARARLNPSPCRDEPRDAESIGPPPRCQGAGFVRV